MKPIDVPQKGRVQKPRDQTHAQKPKLEAESKATCPLPGADEERLDNSARNIVTDEERVIENLDQQIPGDEAALNKLFVQTVNELAGEAEARSNKRKRSMSSAASGIADEEKRTKQMANAEGIEHVEPRTSRKEALRAALLLQRYTYTLNSPWAREFEAVLGEFIRTTRERK